MILHICIQAICIQIKHIIFLLREVTSTCTVTPSRFNMLFYPTNVDASTHVIVLKHGSLQWSRTAELCQSVILYHRLTRVAANVQILRDRSKLYNNRINSRHK